CLLQSRGTQGRGGELLGQPAAHLIGLTLTGDVGARAHPFDNGAIPFDWHGPDVVVPIRTRLGANTVTAIEDRSRADAVAPVALNPVPVVRVNCGQPAVGEIILDRLTDNPPPPGRVLSDLSCRVNDPTPLSARLQERAVPFPGPADGLGRCGFVGGILGNHGYPGHRPVGSMRREPRQRDLRILAGLCGASVAYAA